MNREKVIYLFIAMTSPLLIVNALLEHFAAGFLFDKFGPAVAQIWGSLLSLIIIIWWLFLAFIIVSFIYLNIEERFVKNKRQVQINNDKEIVLSDELKNKLLQRSVLDISLVFNSPHRGVEFFEDIDNNIRFAVMSAEGNEAELEMKQYLSKYLEKQVAIEPGRNARTRRWDRLVTLN